MAKDQTGRNGRIKVQPVRRERPDVRALARLIIDLALSDAELPDEKDASPTPAPQEVTDQPRPRRSA